MHIHASRVKYQYLCVFVSVSLPQGTNDNSWIKMNAGQSGYYRVNYDPTNWARLGHQLNTNHQVTTSDQSTV